MAIIVLWIIIFIRLIYGENYTIWTAVSSPLLPRADGMMAIGYYNDTIFLFGGVKYKRQLIHFNYLNYSIIDKGSNVLPMNVSGSSTYYTQINEILYWIDNVIGNHIVVYNLSNNSFNPNIAMTAGFAKFACLASHDNALFVMGGVSGDITLRIFQIYNISITKWIQGPLLETPRQQHGCIADPLQDELYVIGGGDGSDVYLKSVEKIDITKNGSHNWKYIGNLTQSIARMTVAQRGRSIIIIGGEISVSPYYTYHVHIIDIETGTVVHVGNASYPIAWAAGILIDKIYVFGGRTTTGFVDYWQYGVLPPTKEPTSSPTVTPPNAEKKSNMQIIIGITIGIGVIIIVLVGFILCFGRRYKKRKSMLRQSILSEIDLLTNSDIVISK